MGLLYRLVDRLLPSQEQLALERAEILKHQKPTLVVVDGRVFEKRSGFVTDVTYRYGYKSSNY